MKQRVSKIFNFNLCFKKKKKFHWALKKVVRDTLKARNPHEALLEMGAAKVALVGSEKGGATNGECSSGQCMNEVGLVSSDLNANVSHKDEDVAEVEEMSTNAQVGAKNATSLASNEVVDACNGVGKINVCNDYANDLCIVVCIDVCNDADDVCNDVGVLRSNSVARNKVGKMVDDRGQISICGTLMEQSSLVKLIHNTLVDRQNVRTKKFYFAKRVVNCKFCFI